MSISNRLELHDEPTPSKGPRRVSRGAQLDDRGIDAGSVNRSGIPSRHESGARTINTALHDELDRIFAARDRNDMGPTISALLPILEQHPDEPRVLYEVGGAYDTAGAEATALGFYERAMTAGLDGDLRRRCYLQHGSTLRNLGRLDESASVFAQARAEFPDSVALSAFEALTLHAAGQANTALGRLLELLADHVQAEELDRYKPAMRGNAEYLVSLDLPKASDA